MLHVLNGDCTRFTLEGSSVPGTFVVWADVLHDGPCRLVPPDEWRRMRSEFLASRETTAGSVDDVLSRYEQWDRALNGFGAHDEVVFWFEHDLFDQLLLVRHLHWLRSLHARGATRFSLICIDSFPGVSGFGGLGELTARQLESLLDTRHELTVAEIDLGAEAWTRFCAAEPTGLAALLSADTSALPFLAEALRRFLEEYPSTSNGVSRSERQILDAVRAGAGTPQEAFRATQRMEERIFMGDTSWWAIARGLASASAPLLTVHGDTGIAGRLPAATLAITETGEAVLAGRADHVPLNGIDRWLGGVHLTTDRWRWDAEKGLTVMRNAERGMRN